MALSMTKAKKILKDKTIRGKPITEKQRGLFGVIASGKQPQQLSAIKRANGKEK